MNNFKNKIYYRSIVQYNGKNYSGWQSQKNEKGIQDILKKTIKKIWNIETKIEGASRTDSGVHSYGQVIKFYLFVDINPKRCEKILNEHLPEDILIKNTKYSNEQFSPRFDAKKKLYHYNFSLIKTEPLINPYVFHYIYKIDLKKLKETLSIFIGTNDFKSFCSEPKENTIRKIYNIELIETNFGYTISIEGDGFLKYMIRRIVGAALTASTRNISIEKIKEIFLKKDPKNNLYKMPAKGLILMHVFYDINEKVDNLNFFNI